MEYRLGICDEDYHYVVNLMEYVNSEKTGGLTLVAFSSILAVEEYLKKSYLDGVLVGQDIEICESFSIEHSDMMVITLTSERGICDKEVYKYQSARNIVAILLQRLNVNLEPMQSLEKSFCAVYSPLGRCGKTTLAKGIGVKHTGALYIAMEEYCWRDGLGEEILYHIIFENSKLHQLIDKLRPNEYGLREIKGILSYMDIRQMNRENLCWLKEQLLFGGDYSRVVFDIGSAVLSDLDMLHVMDRIYVPVLEDEKSKLKLQAFRELLRCKEYAALSKKIQYVNVPICHYASEMMMDFISKGEF